MSPTEVATTNRLLWNAAELAEALGVSTRTIRRMDLAAKLPAPLTMGRAVKWRVDEIRSWIQEDCPGRDEWEAIKAERNGQNCN